MIVRIALLALLIWIVWTALQRWIQTSSARSRDRAPARGRLVRCSVCGVYVPEERALKDASSHGFVCSDSCLQAPEKAAVS